MAILKLNLVGPMQSYGVRSRWDYRDTLPYPTKSAVVGMLGCAFGVPREDLESISSKVKVHIRVNKQGRMEKDYQIREYRRTLGSDFEKFVLNKYYLYDASFTVYIESSDEFIDECYNALQDPKWVIFLGRKSCVPSKPLIDKYEETVYKDTGNISEFIEEDSVRDAGIISEEVIRYLVEDPSASDIEDGVLVLNTEVSNHGQKFYRQVLLRQYFVSKSKLGGNNVLNQDSIECEE